MLVKVDIKTKTEGLYYGKTTKNTKYTWAVDPMMSLGPSDLGYTLFWNEKDRGELLLQNGQIAGGVAYADNLTEDVSKARSGLAKQFAFRKEFTPIVVETTKEKYKAAAKKTLEKYADAFVVKCKQIRSERIEEEVG